MTKKNIIKVFALLVISIALLSVSFIYTKKQQERNIRGTHTFANTINNIPVMKTIKIKTNQSELTIYNQDNIWKIKEAADYYVNPNILVNFYDMINNSIVTAILDKPSEKEFKESTSIEIYDEENKILDKIILGELTLSKENRHAIINNNSISYLINKTEKISSELYDWVPHPLLKTPVQILSSIEINGIKIKKDLLEKILPFYQDLEKGLRFLSYISYESVIKKEDIFKIIPNSKPKNITITLSNGAIYSFDLYKNGDLYLLSITLKTTNITKKSIKEFIKSNQPYYNDWLFAINDEIGSMLYNLDLNE